MVTLLKKLFGIDEAAAPRPAASPAETATVRRIVEALDRLEPERARWIASFAYVLGRVAHADLEISSEEVRVMEKIMMEKAGLPEDQAVLVVQIAKSQNVLFGSTEGYLVTREFARLANRDDRAALLECLFAVSAADETVSVVEDNEIRRVCEELKLDHQDFIAARAEYARFLGVLKGPADRAG